MPTVTSIQHTHIALQCSEWRTIQFILATCLLLAVWFIVHHFMTHTHRFPELTAGFASTSSHWHSFIFLSFLLLLFALLLLHFLPGCSLLMVPILVDWLLVHSSICTLIAKVDNSSMRTHRHKTLGRGQFLAASSFASEKQKGFLFVFCFYYQFVFGLFRFCPSLQRMTPLIIFHHFRFVSLDCSAK